MQKRERPAGSPPVTGFASFRNTITELNVANSIGKVNHLFYSSEKSATVLLDINEDFLWSAERDSGIIIAKEKNLKKRRG